MPLNLRNWLIAFALLLIAPWLVVSGIYVWHSKDNPAPPGESAETAAPSTKANAGAWGQLTLYPIVISPPIEYVADDWARATAPDQWQFPYVNAEMLEAFLIKAGMSPEEITSVKSSSRYDARIQGLVVSPDPALVLKMKPEVRARIYLQLGKSQLNFDQANPFCFFGESSDAWLAGSRIESHTRQLVESLMYRDDGYLFVADPEVIRSQIRDADELRRLAKVLLRQSTMFVRLTVKSTLEVDELADYWGKGGRRTDLRPLLESVAGSGQDNSVDIIHLLPTFARNHLYRYPKITTGDLQQPMLANCLWSSLNFFNTIPNDRFLDQNVALTSLKQDYYVIENSFQLGDIVAFLNEEGTLFHVAVYIADDLVFSKNGTSPVSPWVITTIDRLKGLYRLRTSNPRLIFHRRNDF